MTRKRYERISCRRSRETLAKFGYESLKIQDIEERQVTAIAKTPEPKEFETVESSYLEEVPRQ